MATLREALVTVLSGDATLSALLTGGVKNAEDFTFDGGGSDEIPRQANGVLIKPFAIVRFQDSTTVFPLKARAELQSIEIYVYDNVGFVTIDAAISRTKTLLNFTDVTADDRSLAYLHEPFTSRELDAPEISGASCKFVRFMNLHI